MLVCAALGERVELEARPSAFVNHLAGRSSLRNRYVMMRHGESTANERGIIASSPASSIDGYGLSEKGRQQAKASAAVMIREGVIDSSTVIISSDYRRARETAAIVSDMLGKVPIFYEAGLRERGAGEFDEVKLAGMRKVLFAVRWKHLDARDPHHEAFGAESPAAVMDRVTRLLADVEERYSGKTILLVGHADLFAITSAVMNGRSPGDNWMFRRLRNAETRDLELSERRVTFPATWCV